MYEATIRDRVSHHHRLDDALTAILLDLFRRQPQLSEPEALAGLTAEERKTLIGGNLTHNGHRLTDCEVCVSEIKRPYQPFGKDQ